MSDVSVLSHEYKTASELSQTINRALIALKKAHDGLPGAEAITPDQLVADRQSLAQILATLIGLIAPSEGQPVNGPAAMSIPESLVAHLRAERRGDLPYYLDDLTQVATRLLTEPSRLTDADFALLDQLATAVDAETSSVFRRLMRT